MIGKESLILEKTFFLVFILALILAALKFFYVFLFFLSKTLSCRSSRHNQAVTFSELGKPNKLNQFSFIDFLYLQNQSFPNIADIQSIKSNYSTPPLLCNSSFCPFSMWNLDQILHPMAVLKSARRDDCKAPPTYSIWWNFGWDIWG